MYKKKYAPIAVFAYQRIDSLKRLVASLKKNPESKRSCVYFFCDGPKNTKEEEKTLNILKFLNSIKGFKKKKIILRKNNIGLNKNITTGINELFMKHKSIIVLEDDLIISKYFLDYMNYSLTKYCKIKKIWHINGWSFKSNVNNTFDAYFSRYMNCWGWGTWKDRWKSSLNQKLILRSSLNWSRKKINEFNMGSSVNLYDQLIRNYKKKISTWAIFWYATIFKFKGICLTPNYSLVKNCGFGNLGKNYNDFLYYTNFSNKRIKNYPSSFTEDKIIYKIIKTDLYKKNIYYYLNKNLLISIKNLFKLIVSVLKY